MEKFTGKTLEEYEEYAKQVQKKSKIYSTITQLLKEYHRKHNDICMINGLIHTDSSGKPIYYECTVGDGYLDENGKLWTISNYYSIRFWSGSKGVTIYKAINNSIHYKCFVCGGHKDIFGKKYWSSGCRVYEDLEVEEIITKLVKRDFKTYKNIKRNYINDLFLDLMQERLIKTLVYNKIIYKRENGSYEDYKYYGLLE